MAHLVSRSGVPLAFLSALALSACGGGGNGGGGLPAGFTGLTPAPAPAPGPVTVSGKVFVLGAIGNATVCVDRNRNNACDTGEPTSGKTGGDGAYAITYTPSDQSDAAELAAAPMVAQMATGTVADGASVDAINPSVAVAARPFSLSAPAGKRSQINPLTTLVQTGIASGLTPQRSEAAVVLQLEIPTADIYDYQGLPVAGDGSAFEDNARTMALVTYGALNNGVPLRVIDPATATGQAPSDQLVSLTFTSPSDYFAQTFPTDGVLDMQGKVNLVDQRTGRTAGAPTGQNLLYATVRLTPGGWVRCDASTRFTSTAGSPNRSDYCADSTRSAGATLSIDIAGQKMSDVVAGMQALTDGSNTIFGVNPASAFADPNAVFPAGAQLRWRQSVELTQPWLINNANTDASGFATLEALIAARPASGVNLTTGAGTAGLGLYDATHLLRFASTDGGTGVQYYSCESVSPYTSFANCVALGTGTLSIGTVNGARVMSFAGFPPTSNTTTVRGFAEYAGGVYAVRRTKPDAANNLTQSRRLNGPAWQAMKTQLGL